MIGTPHHTIIVDISDILFHFYPPIHQNKIVFRMLQATTTIKRPRIRKGVREISRDRKLGPHPLDIKGFMVVSSMAHDDDEEESSFPALVPCNQEYKLEKLDTRETIEDPQARGVLEWLQTMVTPVFQRLLVSRMLTSTTRGVATCRVPEATTWKLSAFASPRISPGWCRGNSPSSDRWEAIVNTSPLPQEYQIVPGSHRFPYAPDHGPVWGVTFTGSTVVVHPGEALVLHSRTWRREDARQGLQEAGIMVRAHFVCLS
jgi:hypothetical protein